MSDSSILPAEDDHAFFDADVAGNLFGDLVHCALRGASVRRQIAAGGGRRGQRHGSRRSGRAAIAAQGAVDHPDLRYAIRGALHFRAFRRILRRRSRYWRSLRSIDGGSR